MQVIIQILYYKTYPVVLIFSRLKIFSFSLLAHITVLVYSSLKASEPLYEKPLYHARSPIHHNVFFKIRILKILLFTKFTIFIVSLIITSNSSGNVFVANA